MCEKLLANTVVEDYAVRVLAAARGASMKFGVVVFPGSNCDHDVYHVATDLLGCEANFLWHQDGTSRARTRSSSPAASPTATTCAPARSRPLAGDGARRRHAEAGGLVLGICNGFQVLLEAGLLPGAMQLNRGLRFLCRDVHLASRDRDGRSRRLYAAGKVVRMPDRAHGGELQGHPGGARPAGARRPGRLPLLRRAGPRRRTTRTPTARRANIAGICNAEGNVLGLMPHPERCSEPILGNDGIRMFQSVVSSARDPMTARCRDSLAIANTSRRATTAYCLLLTLTDPMITEDRSARTTSPRRSTSASSGSSAASRT